MSGSVNTPFPLGVYVGNANGNSPSAEAAFEAAFSSFTQAMGATPTYFDAYVDFTKPVSQWVSNANWMAWSSKLSIDTSTMTPVIGIPMASIAAGSVTPDQQFQAFASGQYDSVLTGIVQAWAAQGYTNLVFRPGWEMNMTGPTYAGATAQSQADWVKAFQHIYTVLHQAAAAAGVTANVVWNPGIINYSNANAINSLYPGNSYVDTIGADVYSNVWPYSLHDWATGGTDASLAQFMANPVNLDHYWTYPASNVWSNDGSGGHSLYLSTLINFAEQQGKPFAVPETGAGNSNSGHDVQDDPAFPEWLSATLRAAQTAGEKISFVNIWDSNGGGNYAFTGASANKLLEQAAWARYFGSATNTAVMVVPPAIGGLTTATGASSNAGITNNTEPTIHGTAAPGCTITLLDSNGATLGTALVSPAASWLIAIGAPLSQGIHTLSALATNGSASETSSVYTLTIDTTPPAVTAISASQAAGGEILTGGIDILALTMSEAVSVAGKPVMMLSDGGTAVYDASHSTATALAFDYTATKSQKTTNLKVNGITLGSGTISDLAGNHLLSTGLSALPGSNTGTGVNAIAIAGGAVAHSVGLNSASGNGALGNSSRATSSFHFIGSTATEIVIGGHTTNASVLAETMTSPGAGGQASLAADVGSMIAHLAAGTQATQSSPHVDVHGAPHTSFVSAADSPWTLSGLHLHH